MKLQPENGMKKLMNGTMNAKILLDTVCRFEEKEILVSKIAVSVINDMTIQEIFDRLLYDRDRGDII